MTAGLPGTGIGGLFYLLAALMMPLRTAYRYGRGDRDPRHVTLMFKQVAMAVSIMMAVWLTGVFMGLWPTTAVTMIAGRRVSVPAVFMIAPVILTFSTLFSVLGFVELLRLVVARPPSFPTPPAPPPALPSASRQTGEPAWSRSEELIGL